MSVQLIAWAYGQQTGSVTRKSVLLALANRANHDTGLCCPSISRLCEETELGRTAVKTALNDLEASGLIIKVPRHRSNGSPTSNEYRFPADLPSVATRPTPRSPDDPLEPEVRTRREPSLASPPKPRPRNPVWDALSELFGEPETRTGQTARGKVCSSLTAAGATPDEIFRRAKRWALHFDHATLTDHALEKHWSTLPLKPRRIPR